MGATLGLHSKSLQSLAVCARILKYLVKMSKHSFGWRTGRETKTSRTSTSNITALLISERVLLAVFILGHCYSRLVGSSNCDTTKHVFFSVDIRVASSSRAQIEFHPVQVKQRERISRILFGCRYDRMESRLSAAKRRPTPTVCQANI